MVERGGVAGKRGGGEGLQCDDKHKIKTHWDIFISGVVVLGVFLQGWQVVMRGYREQDSLCDVVVRCRQCNVEYA